MILEKSLRPRHCIAIESINVKESDDAELLGITIDKRLSFKKHIENLCQNANYKLRWSWVYKKISNCRKTKLLGNPFTDSQFNDAPLN